MLAKLTRKARERTLWQSVWPVSPRAVSSRQRPRSSPHPIMSTPFRVLSVAASLAVSLGCQAKHLRMPNGSMEPTIRLGEVVELDSSAYVDRLPNRGDLVAFHSPQHGERVWILRVVGLPGETLDTADGELSADGAPLRLPFGWFPLSGESQDYQANQVSFPIVVPNDALFVLGDNAREANDSRFWGSVPIDRVLGEVIASPDR